MKQDYVDSELYQDLHKSVSITCQDITINYQREILLLKRDNEPAKGEWWPVGGRLLRGVKGIEAIKKLVKREIGLEISEIKFLGTARTLFDTSPFNHNSGTDTVNILYFAEAKEKIRLDRLHEDFLLITPEEYIKKREEFNEYTKYLVDLSLKFF